MAILNALVQCQATHGITGATSGAPDVAPVKQRHGGSWAVKYNFISFFLNIMTVKYFLILSGAAAAAE